MGGWSADTVYFFNGSLGRLNIHKSIVGTAADLVAKAQQRYTDYITGNVVEWKNWVGL